MARSWFKGRWAAAMLVVSWVCIAVMWGSTIHSSKRLRTPTAAPESRANELPKGDSSSISLRENLSSKHEEQKESVTTSPRAEPHICDPGLIKPVHPLPPAPTEVEEIRNRCETVCVGTCVHMLFDMCVCVCACVHVCVLTCMYACMYVS